VKLAYVDLCGFRGYHKRLRVEFPDGFTVIDGRNGVGKSTIFDAVEFGVTGTITKYGDATADRETIADYIWWTGEGPPPEERYVEVGFHDGNDVLSVRRTQLTEADPSAIDAVMQRLCDVTTMPKSPLKQLCAASIIRDEHIASLSLDMKEADRYALLCDAIGATDADVWIERGARLASLARRRLQAAEKEVEDTAREVAAAGSRVDELRAGMMEETTVAASASRLQAFIGRTAPPDQLADPARTAIAEGLRQLEDLNWLRNAWKNAVDAEERLPDLRSAIATVENNKLLAEAGLAALEDGEPEASSGDLARQARDLDALVRLGRNLGLHDGHCPLCASNITHSEFENGLAIAAAHARQLDEKAVEMASLERARKAAQDALIAAEEELNRHHNLLSLSEATITEFRERLIAIGLPENAGLKEISEQNQALTATISAAREDLRIIDTLKLNDGLARALRAEAEAKEANSRAEKKLGLARRAESRAQALHSAARRAAGESLDRRLERVLPLMSELYRRLRPHPIWSDIEYKIRGDVRRFLKLQVGNELNPQFIFSSGQRRATGLAFLLSVNLSLAWSKWRTILLDDPVRHVDDFRSIQLTEVVAQLLAGGRQIICAVEDAALADLLCRRLPIDRQGDGKRVTLGPAPDGSLTKLKEFELAPLPQHSLVTGPQRLAV
jgi:energy-coupling factor transporter ATP-binding protein EcfA2